MEHVSLPRNNGSISPNRIRFLLGLTPLLHLYIYIHTFTHTDIYIYPRRKDAWETPLSVTLRLALPLSRLRYLARTRRQSIDSENGKWFLEFIDFKGDRAAIFPSINYERVGKLINFSKSRIFIATIQGTAQTKRESCCSTNVVVRTLTKIFPQAGMKNAFGLPIVDTRRKG